MERARRQAGEATNGRRHGGTGDGRGRLRTGRERVLQQARAMFSDLGYAEVSMQQIADAAGLRKASIYYHFRDKEDLFAQVMLLELQRLRRAIEEQIARGGTFREQLEAVALVCFEQQTGGAGRLSDDFRRHVPEERHGEVHRELERFAGPLEGVFRQARAAGELRDVDPRLAALHFFLMVTHWPLIGEWSGYTPDQPSPVPTDPRAAARTAVDLLFHGVAAPAEGTAEQPGGHAARARRVSNQRPRRPRRPRRSRKLDDR